MPTCGRTRGWLVGDREGKVKREVRGDVMYLRLNVDFLKRFRSYYLFQISFFVEERYWKSQSYAKRECIKQNFLVPTLVDRCGAIEYMSKISSNYFEIHFFIGNYV